MTTLDTMRTDEMSEHYFTYDSRLDSFQSTHPVARSGSNAKGRAKALSWPHKELEPELFARAGFYFQPSPESPDNTVCFLCHRNMKGWEKNDDPFEEHLRLSPDCGWAIVAGIENGLGEYGLEDPTSSAMIEARKATFGDRWPHDGKRGWKCKTKQLVDAGWKYTPTMDSDDMATCTYCQLALDGWEPKDNPMDEHYRRSSECQFFLLMNQYKSAAPGKKKARGKGVRASKVSRLSTQSVATVASDATSLLESPPDHDDSVLTTTSVMTQAGAKRTRAKKGTATKAKKPRAKKEQVVEVLEDLPEHVQSGDEASLPQEEPISTETPEVIPRPRGRKRASATIEDSVLATAEEPAPKKRATRGKLVSAKTAQPSADDAVPDASPTEIDAPLNAGPNTLETEMEIDSEETLLAPKRSRQAGTRKASKQTTRKAKTKTPVELTPEPEPVVDQGEDELAEGHDVSSISNITAVRTSLSFTLAPKKRSRLSKQSITGPVELEPAVAANPISDPAVAGESLNSVEAEPEPTVTLKASAAPATKTSTPSRDESLPPQVPQSVFIQRPRTPEAFISPTPAAEQDAVSPSQSPQSSDAENHPPSSKPSNTSRSARIALEPTTPVRSSPSKRNMIAGLQSTHDWTAVDIEAILDDLDRENSLSTSHLLKGGVDLMSPEKQMTVEEWIYHNAEQAEQKLKSECEALVMAFEREGTRAMQALEGLVVE